MSWREAWDEVERRCAARMGDITDDHRAEVLADMAEDWLPARTCHDGAMAARRV